MAIKLKRFSNVDKLDLDQWTWRIYLQVGNKLFISRYGNTRGTEEESELMDKYWDVFESATDELGSLVDERGEYKFTKSKIDKHLSYGDEVIVIPNKYLTDKAALVKFIEKHLK